MAHPGRRTELRAFLMSRRGRIAPSDVGFMLNPRKRSPGLTREQVAELAGVSFKWFTLFESGAPINASHDTVAAVCRALRLDYEETRHVLALAGLFEGAATVPPEPNLRVLQDILDGYRGGPAALVGPRLDILALNRLCSLVLGYRMDSPPLERNILWSFFVCRPALYANWNEAAPTRVAVFRAHYARHADDPAFAALLASIRAANPAFERVWNDLAVTSLQRSLRLEIAHAEVGLMTFEGMGIPFDDCTDTSVFFYAAADNATAEKLRLLERSASVSGESGGNGGNGDRPVAEPLLR